MKKDQSSDMRVFDPGQALSNTLWSFANLECWHRPLKEWLAQGQSISPLLGICGGLCGGPCWSFAMIKLPRAISKEAIQIQAELTTQEAWRSHKPPLHARGKCATTPTMWQGDELVLGIGKVKGPNCLISILFPLVPNASGRVLNQSLQFFDNHNLVKKN